MSVNIISEFFASSSIPQNADTVGIMELLTRPESVAAMMAMSNAGIPALVGVVRELEEKYANCALFPLAGKENATNRRNIGWMIKFVLRGFGYAPVKGIVYESADDKQERTRLKRFTGSKCFSTSAIYAKSNIKPIYSLSVSVK